MMYDNPYLRNYSPMPTYQNNGINWVQGIEAAKSFPATAGKPVLMMDSESPCFYIKSFDASGMPLPLRVFDYQERTQTNVSAPQSASAPQPDYVTHEELERRLRDFSRSQRGKEVKHDE